MRTIAHISDLHFGRVDPRAAEGLIADLAELKPDVVAISGDLTQRARRIQFAEARDFLARIPFPLLVVPGNHDVPLYDVLRRFALPLNRYRRYITRDLAPAYVDEQLAVVGVNTARSFTWKDGRVSLAQIEQLRSRLCGLGQEVFKVVVTHHPFIPPPDDPTPALVGRAEQALAAMEACGVELLLAGHLHVAYSGDVRSAHVACKRSILVAQAGTAISTRRRNEPNTYNIVVINPPQLTLMVRTWTGHRFEPTAPAHFTKVGDIWQREP